ncbi:MAG TPA: Yip1 family protein [Vicinamibacterales bacterium]|nr:Yip1 family protein [Vicinamibacterales bacterium]
MTSTLDVNVPALKARVTNLLTSPATEWPVIEAEPTTTEKLYRGYIAPLAAIPAVAGFIGSAIIGVTLPFIGTYRDSIPSALAHMLVSFVLSLVGVYVAALVVNKLAPTFESRADDLQALKLVAYAQTPSWLAGALFAVPVLGVLAILGTLYAIYLFYLGLPVMMKTPQSKVIPYMVVAAVVVIAVSVVVGLLSAALTGVGRL